MSLVISNRGQSSYFNSYILQRIEHNKNFLACISGQTGSGKSYSALRLGESLDKEFDIRNVVFTPKEFMDLVNGKTKQLKKGSVIIFDEIQVSMSNLDYQNIQAKLLNFTFQTFRHKNFILFMTSPHFSFINASLRKLFHSRMETVSISQKDKQCVLKPMLLQCNQRTGEIYEKYLRVYTKEYGAIPLKSIRVSLPTPELLKAYEDKKDKFTSELNQSINQNIQDIETTGQIKYNKPFTQIQETIFDYITQNKNVSEISSLMGNSEVYIYHQIKLMEKKGYQFKPIKEGTKVKYFEVNESNGG